MSKPQLNIDKFELSQFVTYSDEQTLKKIKSILKDNNIKHFKKLDKTSDKLALLYIESWSMGLMMRNYKFNIDEFVEYRASIYQEAYGYEKSFVRKYLVGLQEILSEQFGDNAEEYRASNSKYVIVDDAQLELYKFIKSTAGKNYEFFNQKNSLNATKAGIELLQAKTNHFRAIKEALKSRTQQ